MRRPTPYAPEALYCGEIKCRSLGKATGPTSHCSGEWRLRQRADKTGLPALLSFGARGPDFILLIETRLLPLTDFFSPISTEISISCSIRRARWSIRLL